VTATVRHVHLRELGYCNRGSREFFARHGLSWPDFLHKGIEAEKLSSTGDAMALRLVEHAVKVSDGQQ
jgi:hypothetical protein